MADRRQRLTETGSRQRDDLKADTARTQRICTLSPSLRLELLERPPRGCCARCALQLTRRHVVWATIPVPRRAPGMAALLAVVAARAAGRHSDGPFMTVCASPSCSIAIRIKLIGLELGVTRDDGAELAGALRKATRPDQLRTGVTSERR